MDTFDSFFHPGAALNEQIARQLFEMLPEDGPLLVIMDNDGHYWPSDSEKFTMLNVNEYFLKEVCSRIDDGSAPVLTQCEGVSIVASDLSTETVNCGYVALILPQTSPESTLAGIDLIEILLSQMNLIARLIEKNNRLYELQIKHMSSYNAEPLFLN